MYKISLVFWSMGELDILLSIFTDHYNLFRFYFNLKCTEWTRRHQLLKVVLFKVHSNNYKKIFSREYIIRQSCPVSLSLVGEFKVHIFWEGHKSLRNLQRRFVLSSNGQIYGGDSAKFCGLLRIYELYPSRTYCAQIYLGICVTRRAWKYLMNHS